MTKPKPGPALSSGSGLSLSKPEPSEAQPKPGRHITMSTCESHTTLLVSLAMREGIPWISEMLLAFQFTNLLSAQALKLVEWSGGPVVLVIDGLDECGDEPANSLTAYFRNSRDLSCSLGRAGAITRIHDILPTTHDLFQLIPTPSDPFQLISR
jgi:hypothetical protein